MPLLAFLAAIVAIVVFGLEAFRTKSLIAIGLTALTIAITLTYVISGDGSAVQWNL